MSRERGVGAWPKTPLVPPEAVSAWDLLIAGFMDYRSPCTDDDDPDLWLSDDPDEIEAACHRCQGCRVFIRCAAYADAADETYGVWGGTDRRPAEDGNHNQEEAA